jgi:hypothetical protein
LETKFIPHGKCSYSVENNIITINAIGPWNLEFFKQMHFELTEIVLHQVDINNFAILLILEGDSLATQDGLEYHFKLVSAGVSKAIAVNSAMSNTPHMMQTIFKKVYDQAGVKNKIFDCSKAANTWLIEQLSKKY